MCKYYRFKPPPVNSALPYRKCSLVIKRRIAWGLSCAWSWWYGFDHANGSIPFIRTVKADPMSTTPTEPADEQQVEACPECGGSSSLYRREWKDGGVRVEGDERYKHWTCGATFGEPIRRSRADHELVRRVDSWLRENVIGNPRKSWVKAKEIAEDIDEDPRQVGRVIAALRDTENGFDIESRPGRRASAWHVQNASGDGS